MSFLSKLFGKIKLVDDAVIDEAAKIVKAIAGVVATIEADLADGHIDGTELVGLLMKVVDLVTIAKTNSGAAE